MACEIIDSNRGANKLIGRIPSPGLFHSLIQASLNIKRKSSLKSTKPKLAAESPFLIHAILISLRLSL